MKIQITNYTFNASARTVTFSDYPSLGISLARVLLVVNAKSGVNKALYNFMDPTTAATVSGNVLTLNPDINMTGMLNTDPLLIFYEDPEASQLTDISKLISGEDLVNKVLGIAHKPVTGVGYSRSRHRSTADTISKDYIKNAAGTLSRFHLQSINASACWLHIFNKASAPVNGDTPIYKIKVPAAASADLPTIINLGNDFFDLGGTHFATGIAWGISTTRDTFTDAGTGTNYIVSGFFS